MMEVERSSWQNRCVLRGCAGVDVVLLLGLAGVQ